MHSLSSATSAVDQALSQLPLLEVTRHAPLSAHTRFGIGGPADLFVETSSVDSFLQSLDIVRASGLPFVVIGGGTNLIVSDEGFRGVVLKLVNRGLSRTHTTVRVDSGVVLQNLVDYTIDASLRGLDTMTGIPGFTGAAIYGNAGAYGHSISERVSLVRYYDGASVREMSHRECQFHYRESIFKRRKDWLVLSAELTLEHGDAAALRKSADKIREIRDKKYPPSMKCAGSIFKNYLLVELPPEVAAQIPPVAIIEGKVPSAWFLEQVGAKGMQSGDIHVAAYHANLIYNAGTGTARQVLQIIGELKHRIQDRFGIPLEEEVQYVGFTTDRIESEPAAVTI